MKFKINKDLILESVGLENEDFNDAGTPSDSELFNSAYENTIEDQSIKISADASTSDPDRIRKLSKLTSYHGNTF